MPPISELLKKPDNVSEESFPLAELRQMQNTNLPSDPQPPVANPVIRCPLPSLGQVSPDALRQFYSSNQAKFRIWSLTK